MAGYKTEKNTTQVAGQRVARNNTAQITHKFDHLKMYFGEPFEVGNGLIIHQPTVGQILEVGEQDFYAMLYVFISNPTTYRLQLWDLGIDWNKISSYTLFTMLIKSVDSNVAKVIFGDVDFKGFEIYAKTVQKTDDDGEETEVQIPTLYNTATEMELSEDDYTLISEYLQTMFNIFPKVEKAKGRSTKEAIIEEDRMNLAMRQKKDDSDDSSLLSLVSACVNHPGFKYKLQELRDVGICQFMDSVQRLQVYESSTALMKGMYSGFVDGSKLNANDYNWMRSLANN